MVLSNSEIFNAIEQGYIQITPRPISPSSDHSDSPWNTTSLDLRLGSTISIPKERQPFVFNPKSGDLTADFFLTVYDQRPIDRIGGFALDPGNFIIANTLETIYLPITSPENNCCARVEGRSSYARMGLLVHFTAPTIHAGFEGTITLELMNLGKNPIMLYPGIYICQLIFEKVEGEIYSTISQFLGQTTPEGR